MWRRVASQTPDTPGGANRDYIKAYSALNQLLRDGKSLSGQERKCVFLNTGGPRFATISQASGLDFDDDSRAVAMVDWDFDGDLDLWFGNRTAPRVRFMRNDTPSSGHFVQFKLTGKTCNRDAIGARVEVYLPGPGPRKLIKTLHAGEAFLSQSTKWVHFGLGDADRIEKIVVRWPGGKAEEIAGVAVDRFYTIEQGAGVAKMWQPPRGKIELAASKPMPHPMTNLGRTVIVGRLPFPLYESRPILTDRKAATASESPSGENASESRSNGDPPRLVNLWATWCKPCLQELGEFSQQEQRLRAAGVSVVALNVDELNDNPQSDLTKSKQILERLRFPFEAAAITPETAGFIDVFQRAFFSLRRPLPVPSSFLIDEHGRLAVIYRGPVSVDQVLSDLPLLKKDRTALRDATAPMPGIWNDPCFLPDPKHQALAFMREGYTQMGVKYLHSLIRAEHWAATNDQLGPDPLGPRKLASMCDPHLADMYRLLEDPKGVNEALELALRCDPTHVSAHVQLGAIAMQAGRIDAGVKHLEAAYEYSPRGADGKTPKDPKVITELGTARAVQGRLEEAIALWEQALKIRPGMVEAEKNLQRARELLKSRK